MTDTGLNSLSLTFLDSVSLNTYFSHISEVETFVENCYNESTFHNLPDGRYLTWDSLTEKAKQNVFLNVLEQDTNDETSQTTFLASELKLSSQI